MQRRHRSILELKQMESAKTFAFSNPALACRLTSMGILPGASVQLIRSAPFGQAFYIKVDGVRLALRQDEAASILIEA